MRSSVRAAWTVALMLGVAVSASCGDENGPTDTDPTRVQVTVRLDGAAESGVGVELFASGGTTALEDGTTSASGQVAFEVDPGTYDVEVEIPTGAVLDEGEAARKSVTVAEGNTAPVTFELVTEGGVDLAVVTLNPSSFSPPTVTINVGGTVRWVNGAAIAHTVTPDGHSEWSNVSMTASGQTFEHVFDSAGQFPYLCQLHAGMTGTVTVN